MRFSTAIMVMGVGTGLILAAAHGVVELIRWVVNA